MVGEKNYHAVFLRNAGQPKKIAILTKGEMSIAVGWHLIVADEDGNGAGRHFFYKSGPVGSKQLRPLREKLHGNNIRFLVELTSAGDEFILFPALQKSSNQFNTPRDLAKTLQTNSR
jgi:hypothetical protein